MLDRVCHIDLPIIMISDTYELAELRGLHDNAVYYMLVDLPSYDK